MKKVQHLLPTRGNTSACGQVSCEECSPEINVVTCKSCLAVHDAYCAQFEEEEEA